MSKPFKQQCSSPLITQKKLALANKRQKYRRQTKRRRKIRVKFIEFRPLSSSSVYTVSESSKSNLMSPLMLLFFFFCLLKFPKHSLRSIYEKRVCLSFPSPSALFSGTGGTQHFSHSFHHFFGCLHSLLSQGRQKEGRI